MTEMRLVMPDPPAVIPDLTREPVLRAPWIAERVRNDGNEACHAGPSGCHREPTVSGSKLQVDHEPMTRHCEECSDAAIHAFRRYGSPRPGGLAMTKVRVRFFSVFSAIPVRCISSYSQISNIDSSTYQEH